MIPYGKRRFKLSRMRQLLDRLDNPQDRLPVVHVAGTKGKGSTAAMVAAVVSEAGYRTGLFTSPHLDQVEQRIAVDNRPCSSAEFVDLVETLMPIVAQMDRQSGAAGSEEGGPTYFEITTALALLHFVRSEVDVAVLEVGLGGRLDSTNVCRPKVSIITSISLDHTQQLGDTLEKIAAEKAGIIKPRVPVISGVAQPGPREVIRATCRRRGARLRELGVDFDFRYRPPQHMESQAVGARFDYESLRPQSAPEAGPTRYQDLDLPLLGRHQAANAAVALAALEELARSGWKLPEAAVRRGLAGLCWPARIEVLARRPAVVVDSAHNLASIEALLEVLEESFVAKTRRAIFATTLDKDIRGMLGRLLSVFDEVVFTRYRDNPRAVPTEQLRALARELTGTDHRAYEEPDDAWRRVRDSAGADDLICVTGSFFIAAQVRRIVRDERNRAP
jgi:dihydrofolate synthase/folylpolyglutamate synthase